MAPGRAAVDGGAHRSVPTPLKRGTAAVAVAGGALSLMGAAAPATPIAPVALSTQAPEALQPSVVPVVPEPDVLDAGRLVAAVQRVEKQVAEAKTDADRRAAEARKAAGAAATAREAAEEAAAARKALDCGLDLSDLGAVKANARAAARFLGCQYGEPTMFGVAGRAGTSDHPSGKAVDFMVERAAGDALAACALENADALGITYVIWRQRINYGSGWESMEDRGGATANHMDHVHVSFGPGSGDGPPVRC